MTTVKREYLIIIIGLVLATPVFLTMGYVAHQIKLERKDTAIRMAKIGGSIALEHEGSRLINKGLYEEALEKYREANSDKYDLHKTPYRGSSGHMRGVYFLQGRYKEALTDLDALVKYFPEHGVFKDERNEYISLLEAEKLGSPKPIYDFIDALKKSHAKQLPPQGYTFGNGIVITTILRLYDMIGDYDAGIAYIDMCMEFFKLQDIKKYGAYKPGHADEEYLKVRKAFEAEKQAGGPTCKGKPVPEGSACIGDATKALIQSDYFPW